MQILPIRTVRSLIVVLLATEGSLKRNGVLCAFGVSEFDLNFSGGSRMQSYIGSRGSRLETSDDRY